MGNGMKYIAYLNDDNRRKSGYFELVSITDKLVSFRTRNGNVITIPVSRLLKIKEVASVE